MSTPFARAQAAYDAMEPPEFYLDDDIEDEPGDEDIEPEPEEPDFDDESADAAEDRWAAGRGL